MEKTNAKGKFFIKDILEENETICKELTGFKGTLRLPFDEASGKGKYGLKIEETINHAKTENLLFT